MKEAIRLELSDDRSAIARTRIDSMALPGKALWSDSRVTFPLLLAALAAMVVLASVSWRAYTFRGLEASTHERDSILQLANELRHSSEALTRWSRSEVTTGDPRYRELFETLLEVHHGNRARPGRTTAVMYWSLREYANAPIDETGPREPFLSLVAAAGATADELALLEGSKDTSEKLVEIERNAMDLAASGTPGGRDAALASLFDQRYSEIKSRVMRPVEQLTQTVLTRSRQRQAEPEKRIHFANVMLTGAAFGLFAGLGLTVFGFRRLVGGSINTLASQVWALVPDSAEREHRAAARSLSLTDSLVEVAKTLGEKDARLQQALEELRGEETRLRLFIEHAPVAIALFDTEMRYLACSERWLDAYGLAGQEILGRSHYEVFPEIPDHWREAHRRGLAGELLRAEEDRFERADGSVSFIRWEITPWRTPDGRIAGIAIMSEDISAAVRQRRESLGWSVAFQSAQVGLAFVDPTEAGVPRVLVTNPELDRMLGQPAGALNGREVMSLVPADLQESMRSTLPALESTGHVRFESELLDRQGRRVPVIMDITNQPDTADGRRRCIVFVLELSERNRLLGQLAQNVEALRKTNRELLEARDAIIAAQSTRNAILSNLSHELRTPLNHVLGFASLLEQAALPPKAQERVHKIAAAGGRLLHLVNGLLDAVRTETGQLDIDARDVTLADVLAEVPHAFGEALRARQQDVLVELDPALPRRIHADRRHLAQVLRELVDNAVKFSGQGPIRMGATAAQAVDGSPRIRIEVEDHGIGIDEAQRQKLFGWFRQGDDSATRARGGLGMGLILAQRIVTLMDGEIGYRPTPGGGSTFWIELPLVAAADADADGTAPADLPALRLWLEEWLPRVQAADMSAALLWAEHPPGIDRVLGNRVDVVDAAIANFDFAIVEELVRDALAGGAG